MTSTASHATALLQSTKYHTITPDVRTSLSYVLNPFFIFLLEREIPRHHSHCFLSCVSTHRCACMPSVLGISAPFTRTYFHVSADSPRRSREGALLPAGALACVWIYGLHRHPALWESPDAFLPGRWLDGAAARQVIEGFPAHPRPGPVKHDRSIFTSADSSRRCCVLDAHPPIPVGTSAF